MSLTDTLTGHEMLDSDGQDDGEFLLVRCACGWGAGRLSTADAFATYAEHLEDAVEAALAVVAQIRSEAQTIADEHSPLNDKNPYCPTCGAPGDVKRPCTSLARAVAILALTGDTEEAT